MELTQKDIDLLESLRAYAENDVYDEEDMRSLLNGNGVIPGDEPEFVREILDNMCRIVFTHEWQPIGTCRHTSISFRKGYGVANEQTIAKILMCLGFTGGDVHTYIEENKIFNAIQLI